MSKNPESSTIKKPLDRWHAYKNSFTNQDKFKGSIPPSTLNKAPTIYNTENSQKKGLRPIIIDGSNVAFSHGKSSKFSLKGIEIVIDYFKKRGHSNVVAFLPQYR